MSAFILTKNNKNEVLGRLRKALFNNNKTEFKLTIQDKVVCKYDKNLCKPIETKIEVYCVKDLSKIFNTSMVMPIEINIEKPTIIDSIYVFLNNKITFSGGRVIIDGESHHIIFSPIKLSKKICIYYDKDYEDENGSDGCCTCAECFYLAKCKIAKERCTPEQRKFYGMEE